MRIFRRIAPPAVFAAVLAIVAAVGLTFVPNVGAQNDVLIGQRQFPVCNPTGTTPFLYYNASDGKWHCTASAPVATLGGALSWTAGRMVAGLVDVSSTASGTVQSTEYTLNSITIPSGAFSTTTRGITCTAWGTGAANANAKNLKFYFGGTAVATVTGTTDSGKDYLAKLTVLRTGSSTQTGYAEISSDVGAPDALAASAALAITDTADIIVSVKSANTAAAAASATGKGMTCLYLN